MKPSANDKIRLQVFLSHSGVCSRRKAMDLVFTGHVSLNDVVCREPSTPVDPQNDIVSVDGRVIKVKQYQYVLLNKPQGYVTTVEDSHAAKKVMELLPPLFQHLNPVGRLDKETEGLLLFTNDGDVAYHLTHPRFDVEKTYLVQIEGRLTEDEKDKLESGVFVDGEKTAPAKIKDVRFDGNTTRLSITIHEGRKRQIRYMFLRFHHKVVFLKRIIQGPLKLGDLKSGQYRPLTPHEIAALKAI